MDDQRFGGAIRAARISRGWRQVDLAASAGVSTATVSRIERGHLDTQSLRSVRQVAAALEIRVELLPRSRAANVDRLVSARHGALAESVVSWLLGINGWVVRPEVSFSKWGERGIVDLIGWHQTRAAVLVIELKTEIVDVGEILGTLDRKRRLGRAIARDLGWEAGSVSTALLVAEGRTNRRRVDAHETLFRAALPEDGRRFRKWLTEPLGEVHALTFVPNRHPGTVRTGFATVRRVRPGAARSRGSRGV